MAINYLELIKKIELFHGLEEKALNELLNSFSLVEVEENEMLFLQGDEADAMYILLSGYLLAILETKNRHIEVVGKIAPGEVVGEMGVLTQKPRTLSIKAISPSQLLKLSEEDFVQFINFHPQIMYKILLNTIARGQETIHALSHQRKQRHIILMPTLPTYSLNSYDSKNSEVDFFLQNLKQQISKKKNIIFLEEEALYEIYHEQELKGLINYLDKMEQSYTTIVSYLENQQTFITKHLLERANQINFIGLGSSEPKFSKFNLDLLEKSEMDSIEKNLILLWKENSTIKNTRFWLGKANFNLHHHIFLNKDADYQRVLRFFEGTAIGVVLSGGGFRCFSHVGVIKALKEKNIPIDIIGGTSVGAGTAAYYLISKNAEEFNHYLEKASDAMRKTLRWVSMTLPVISIYSTYFSTSNVRKIFKNQRIEDLALPFFAISCNVSNNTEVVHRTGKIWRAVRASAAVPGLFPPIVENGHLLYDGGLLNNLPTDHMRNLLGEDGIVIASDLGITGEDLMRYYFPPSLPPLKLLFFKLKKYKPKYVFPHLFNTLIKSMLSGSVPRYKTNTEIANYYVHPDFSGYDLLIIKESEQKQMVDLGYKTALAVLADFHYDSED